MSIYAITTRTYTENQSITLGGVQYDVSAGNIYANSSYAELLSKILTDDTLLIIGIEDNRSIIQAFGQKNILVFVDSTPSDVSLSNISFKSLTIYQGLEIFTGNSFNVQSFVSPTVTSITLSESSLSNFSNLLSLNKIILRSNQYPNDELIIPNNCLDIRIETCAYSNVSIPENLTSLYIENLTNEISITSTKNLNVQECNVSCTEVNLENDYSAISFNNSGTISSVKANDKSGIYIKLERCENLSLTDCKNVNCGGDIFTNATNSLTIKDTTFNTLSMDFESNKVEVSNISAAGNTLNIRNYNGKTEDLKIDDNISFDSCSIWSCPEIVPSKIKSDTIYLIDSPITEIPSEWANDSIYLYSCHNIESISGTYATLIVINCSKLKEVDVSNIDLYRFIWNQSLDTIIKDGVIYGNSGELIDNISPSPTLLYGNILRFNAFKNLEIYSAPNIINGKLIYNKQYNIVANTNIEVENSIGSNVNDENMNYTGLCTLGQDVTSDYSAGLGPYFIWTDFTNINTSPFTDPIDICGYNMNTDVKNGLIDMTSSYNSIYPETIITDIPSSSFNNKNILVLSTSDLKPASEPNKFTINLVV